MVWFKLNLTRVTQAIRKHSTNYDNTGIYECLNTWVYIQIPIYIWGFIYRYNTTSVYVYILLQLYIHTYIPAQMYTYICVCKYVCVYTYIYVYLGSISSLMQISLNIIDILCLHIFFWIRSNSPYYFYCILGELIYVLSIVACIPSTFCPTLGHHQGGSTTKVM